MKGLMGLMEASFITNLTIVTFITNRRQSPTGFQVIHALNDIFVNAKIGGSYFHYVHY